MHKVDAARGPRYALVYAGRIRPHTGGAMMYYGGFPLDEEGRHNRLVESAKRAGALLAEVALHKMGSVIEALAWVQWNWREAPLAPIDAETRDAARAVLMDRASESERAAWALLWDSGESGGMSMEDVRWWLDVEAPKLAARLRAAA